MAEQRLLRHARGISLLTPKEAGDRLRCSEKHVYRLIARGLLRAVDIAQPGSRKPKTRIRSDDLDAYIDASTRAPRAA
jgi:excisionase family DNA binding protein